MNVICKLCTRNLKTSINFYKKSYSSLLSNYQCLSNGYVRYHSNSSMIRVAIINAGGNVGKATSLMLKQSPYIDELCLYDSKPMDGFASDLNYIDTKCKVKSAKDIEQALSNSDVIVLLAFCHHSDGFTYSNIFEKNAPIVKELAIKIAKHSPKSLIAIAAEPINSMVPLFSETLKRHGHYNPNTVFGVTTIDTVRVNKFVAEVLGVEPECVVVPIIGGHSERTIVPVLSKATPCNELKNEELEDITNSVRKADDNLLKIRSDGAYLSSAFALTRFTISLVKGLKGLSDIIECSYVKSAVHSQLKYMVTPLLLGPGIGLSRISLTIRNRCDDSILGGISKNLGIPDLTDYEICLLENAVPILMEEIKKGEFVGGRPMEIVDGKLQDKPICDTCDINPKAPRCPPDHCELQSLFANK